MRKKFVRKDSACILAALEERPTVVHRGSPQPFVGIVLDEQGDETKHRIPGIDGSGWILCPIEPRQNGCRIRQPPPILHLDHRHLDRSGPGADALLVPDRRPQSVRNPAEAEIGFQLSRVVGDP